MEEKTVDETLFYGGESVTVRRVTGEFCPVCGEGVWDSESNRRLDEAQTTLIKAVRRNVGADIRRIRKKLKLTQEKLAESIGLGKLAFSRYEQGKTRPSVALIKLLRLIDSDPNLLTKLREMETPYKGAAVASGTATRRKHAMD